MRLVPRLFEYKLFKFTQMPRLVSYLRNRFLSFRYAFRGISVLITEPNFQIHCCAFVFVVVLGCYFKISADDWISLLLVSALVLVAEAINTSIENLANRVSIEIHPLIAKAKDVSASAVLIAALFAIIVGVFVFIKYL